MYEEEISQKLPETRRPTDSQGYRLKVLEQHNQIRKISSLDGSTYFDADNNILQMTGGTIEGGDITGATINGGIIRTSESGERVELKVDSEFGPSVNSYDSNGVLRTSLANNSVSFFDESGVLSGYILAAENESGGNRTELWTDALYITNGRPDSTATVEVESAAYGTFVSADDKLVTVVGGIITSIEAV